MPISPDNGCPSHPLLQAKYTVVSARIKIDDFFLADGIMVDNVRK